jgi:hypothetical protein
VSALYECQQIRSYKSTAVVLFTEKKAEQVKFSAVLSQEIYSN